MNKKSNILGLNPFIDSQDGLLRVGGRLTNTNFERDKIHPVILPKFHSVSKLIAFDEHIRLVHCGPQQRLFSLRERYCTLVGRNLAKQVVRSCVTGLGLIPNLESN